MRGNYIVDALLALGRYTWASDIRSSLSTWQELCEDLTLWSPRRLWHPNLLLFETGSWDVALAGLGLKILLPQPPKYWDYRCASPCLALIFFKGLWLLSGRHWKSFWILLATLKLRYPHLCCTFYLNYASSSQSTRDLLNAFNMLSFSDSCWQSEALSWSPVSLTLGKLWFNCENPWFPSADSRVDLSNWTWCN
jgi:hypothetical protein